MDFVDVLQIRPAESRVHITDDEVEVAKRVGLNLVVAFQDLRVDTLQDLRHHVEPISLGEGTVGQVAVDEAESPLEQSELDQQTTLIADETGKP